MQLLRLRDQRAKLHQPQWDSCKRPRLRGQTRASMSDPQFLASDGEATVANSLATLWLWRTCTWYNHSSGTAGEESHNPGASGLPRNL
jgi:hypothetical protein